MNKIMHLAIVLFSATSLTTSVFAGRGDIGADTSSPAPVQPVVTPVVTPIPSDTTDTTEDTDPNMDPDTNADNNTTNQTAGLSKGQTAGLAVGGVAALGLTGVASVLGYKKVNNNIRKSIEAGYHDAIDEVAFHHEINNSGDGALTALQKDELIDSAKKVASAKTPEESRAALKKFENIASPSEDHAAAHGALKKALHEKLITLPNEPQTRRERAKRAVGVGEHAKID